MQSLNQQWQNSFNDLRNGYTNITVPTTPDIPSTGQITIDLNKTSSTAGMLNYHQAVRVGLSNDIHGNYPEALGTMMGGNDGHTYVMKLYTNTNRKHWYRVD